MICGDVFDFIWRRFFLLHELQTDAGSYLFKDIQHKYKIEHFAESFC